MRSRAEVAASPENTVRVQKIRSPVSVQNNAINIKKATHRDAVIETDLSGSFYISTQWVSHLIARFIPRDPVPCTLSLLPSYTATSHERKRERERERGRPFLSQPAAKGITPNHPPPFQPPSDDVNSPLLCVRVTPRWLADSSSSSLIKPSR